MNTSSSVGVPSLTSVERRAVLASTRGRRRDEQGRIAGDVEPHAELAVPPRRRRFAVRARARSSRRRSTRAARRARRRSVSAVTASRWPRGQLERRAARHRAHQRLRRVEREQLAVIHDPDPVGERGRLVHVVRRQDERDAAVAQLAQAVPHEQPRGRVEPGRRLVEEQHLRRVHQRPRDHHALRLAAARTCPASDFAAVEQPELLEQLVGAAVALRRRDAVVGGVEDEVGADRERAVEVAALRDDGERAARPTGSRDDVDAARPSADPLVGRTRVVSTPTVVVFPAPFGPSRPNISPARDLEADPVDGVDGRSGIALDQLAATAACVLPTPTASMKPRDDEMRGLCTGSGILGRVQAAGGASSSHGPKRISPGDTQGSRPVLRACGPSRARARGVWREQDAEAGGSVRRWAVHQHPELAEQHPCHRGHAPRRSPQRTAQAKLNQARVVTLGS